MNKIPEHYYDFWAKTFNVNLDQMKSPESLIVTGGRYIEKHKDQYLFFYSDLLLKKNILAASHTNLQRIRKEFDIDRLSSFNADSIRSEKPFAKMELAFCDIDFCLLDLSEFTPLPDKSFDVRTIKKSDQPVVEKFCADLSKDDADVLDLNLEKDFALGIFTESQELAGLARFVKLRDTLDIADITVVVSDKFRGRGYASVLVSKLAQNLIDQNLHPKYRVKEDNISSIQVAKKLGFKPMFRLLAFTF